jgi:hypothetical protein
VGFLLVTGLALWLWRFREPVVPESRGPSNNVPTVPEKPIAVVTEIHSVDVQTPPDRQILLGESILAGYGRLGSTPENDLTLMSHLMENSVLLLKSAAHRPLGGNEDWARFLLGKNAAHERFLPDNHQAVNNREQLVDRWGAPLFIHALGGGRYEIRSAGPDQKMWTADDLQRNSDGAFSRGMEAGK